MTTVNAVQGCDRPALMADPRFVYVGRRCHGWPASDWGNPFKVGMPTDHVVRLIDGWGRRKLIDRDIVCIFDAPTLDVEMTVELYRQYVLACPTLRRRLGELRGKTLGCWCVCWNGNGDPTRPCHAVVLAKLADATTPAV